MPSFKDSKGRAWTLPEFTEGTIIGIREKLGIDLHLVMDRDQAMAEKAFSAKGFAEMLWYLVAPECESRGVTDLPAAMNYQAKNDAKDAFLEALMTFYHGPQSGREIAKAMRPVEKAQLAKALADLKRQFGDSPA